MSLAFVPSFSVEETDFYRLFGALCVKSERLLEFARLRRVARWVTFVALAVLTGGFVSLTSGSTRFPDFWPLVVPLGICVLGVVIHALAGRQLGQLAPLFKALYREDDASYPLLHRTKLKLENDGVFDVLRRERGTLDWRSALEESEGTEQVNHWLLETLGHRLT
jgi:hypothetical protein